MDYTMLISGWYLRSSVDRSFAHCRIQLDNHFGFQLKEALNRYALALNRQEDKLNH